MYGYAEHHICYFYLSILQNVFLIIHLHFKEYWTPPKTEVFHLENRPNLTGSFRWCYIVKPLLCSGSIWPILIFKLSEIPVNLSFFSWYSVTFSHLWPWTCMQSHTDTLMCFEVHTIYVAILAFYYPKKKKSIFSLFSMLKKTFSDSDGKRELSFLFSMYM